MAIDKVAPGEVKNLEAFARETPDETSNALVKTDIFETILLRVAPDNAQPQHALDSPVVVHCLSGRARVLVDGQAREMGPNDWMHLPEGVMFGAEAQEESRLLVTIIFAGQEGQANRLD